MFGELNPRIPGLLTRANTWTKVNTWSQPSLGATTVAAKILANPTPAANNAQQASPAIEWQSSGFRSSGSISQSVKFRSYGLGVQGAGAAAGAWRLESSLADAAYVTGLEYLTTAVDGIDFPRLNVRGAVRATINNSSTIGTLQSFDIVNPSGNRTNITATFGSTIRWGVQATDTGATIYRAAGAGAIHYFQVGSTIESTFDIVQIYSGGMYNYGGLFNQGRVTAGLANTTPPAFLNTFGSLAVRGVLKTENATLTENETMVYCDASNANICAGTPAACSTYTGAGEATCLSHSALGCSWVAAVTEDCGIYGGVDISTCENQSGCTFNQSSCSSATDQSSCESQDDTYGGSCAWNSCSGFSDEASCNGQAGCSASTGDCSGIGDESSCNGQSPCSWDSENNVCTGGSYFISCNGDYCSGTYYDGSCVGTHTITAASCSGTADCGNISSSTPCNAEAGCSWVSGMTLTLPVSSQANNGNTSRVYSIVNIGETGVVTVVPGSGDSILGSAYSAGIVLNAQNERVMLHHHNVQLSCSLYNSNQSVCESKVGCSWTAAIVCSSIGDEATCNIFSGSGCTWNGSSCEGAGSASSCVGSFTSSKPWIIHQLSN